MSLIVDPYKIRKYRVEINKIEVTPYRVDISLSKYKKVDQVVDDKLWFTDEEGNLDRTDVAELYWILFTEPEYQKISGIYYNDKLVALWMVDRDDKSYITWDNLGVLVVNCLEGMNYQKENLKNE